VTDYSVIEGEAPEVLERNLSAAGYLLAGATAFFFLAFVFAFFYLHSIDQPSFWKPQGVDPSIGWGTSVVACIVLSAVLLRLGLRDRIAERFSAWRIKGGGALLLGVVALALQALTWAEQGFGPADGAYASVYVGWTAFLFLFVLITLFWIETTLATSLRYAKTPIPSEPAPGEASGDRGRTAHDISDPLSLVRSELAPLSFYWTFLAGIAVITWVVLYLVA
jgi:heme/copper-type cytochrome/quinol oxidase subunit 3